MATEFKQALEIFETVNNSQTFLQELKKRYDGFGTFKKAEKSEDVHERNLLLAQMATNLMVALYSLEKAYTFAKTAEECDEILDLLKDQDAQPEALKNVREFIKQLDKRALPLSMTLDWWTALVGEVPVIGVDNVQYYGLVNALSDLPSVKNDMTKGEKAEFHNTLYLSDKIRFFLVKCQKATQTRKDKLNLSSPTFSGYGGGADPRFTMDGGDASTQAVRVRSPGDFEESGVLSPTGKRVSQGNTPSLTGSPSPDTVEVGNPAGLGDVRRDLLSDFNASAAEPQQRQSNPIKMGTVTALTKPQSKPETKTAAAPPAAKQPPRQTQGATQSAPQGKNSDTSKTTADTRSQKPSGKPDLTVNTRNSTQIPHSTLPSDPSAQQNASGSQHTGKAEHAEGAESTSPKTPVFVPENDQAKTAVVLDEKKTQQLKQAMVKFERRMGYGWGAFNPLWLGRRFMRYVRKQYISLDDTRRAFNEMIHENKITREAFEKIASYLKDNALLPPYVATTFEHFVVAKFKTLSADNAPQKPAPAPDLAEGALHAGGDNTLTPQKDAADAKNAADGKDATTEKVQQRSATSVESQPGMDKKPKK